MPAMQKLPDNHPMKVAWDAYRASDEGKNSDYWARYTTIDNPRGKNATVHHPHLEGSLWAAFVAGYDAANQT